MKYEIYDNNPKPVETTVLLKLVQDHDGTRVAVVNTDGTLASCGNLVVFNPDGTITLPGRVSPDLGFERDIYGRIRTRP